jgi:prolyl-tRNA editing enzyme YbaK/EbsC (Cys-tRNA(Pro) deacylase)
MRFAAEEEVGAITGGVLAGGVPPFGSLFGIQTYLDHEVAQNDRIVFNAGDRRVSIAISVRDYMLVENPRLESLIVAG